MKFGVVDSFKCKRKIKTASREYTIFDIRIAAEKLGIDLKKLPFSLKILLENMLRHEDGVTVTKADIESLAAWQKKHKSDHEISFYPARVLMQDFTGVPAIVDLAAMRNAMRDAKGDSNKINPLIPVDLVIDHSVQVYKYASSDALSSNVAREMNDNWERYQLLKWAQKSLNNFRVVPPGTGICHQVNLEYLAKCIWTNTVDGECYAYPDTVIGTDSHTTMINGLSVLGWGVGGIEAEAALLGQPMSMLIPELIGFKLTGALREGVTATDLVLTVTQMLRKKGVVGKFVEFYGAGLRNLPVADRATIANMAPEYGATCGMFPLDEEVQKYLLNTGRADEEIVLTAAYAQQQGLWQSEEVEFSDTLELDMSTVESSLAGPKRPQDRVVLRNIPQNFAQELPSMNKNPANVGKRFAVKGSNFDLGNGDVVIAAITSCTNTSNPSVMIAAGLLAKKAQEKGVQVKPWVKTSLAPGSQVVSAYLEKSGLQKSLDYLGFHVVGYGCTTCIGNSGPLPEEIDEVIKNEKLVVSAVLSGNRNFEGRIHSSVRANYLASPPLCVAYALAGNININFMEESLGKDKNGNPVFLRDIWPSAQEIQEVMAECLSQELFRKKYAQVFEGTPEWKNVSIDSSPHFSWSSSSTYIKKAPYFDSMSASSNIANIKNARILALFGDSITTDHISPAGSIADNSPAAAYLLNHGVEKKDFNSYGARRGNHELMVRGTFANVRIKNEMLDGIEGGYTKYCGQGDVISIYDAAQRYMQENTPLVIFAGKEYGTGSSRDWAAKGTKLLGVKAVIAESFERIHRSNLVGMGVLPLLFKSNTSWKDYKLTGEEEITLLGIDSIRPKGDVTCIISKKGNIVGEIKLTCAIATEVEMEYMQNGGILPFVLKKLAN
jgi:aconitate hydratase